jgi:hypothetical protein
MSRKRKTARIVKPADHDGAGAAGEVVADQLEALAREGAREIPQVGGLHHRYTRAA